MCRFIFYWRLQVNELVLVTGERISQILSKNVSLGVRSTE